MSQLVNSHLFRTAVTAVWFLLISASLGARERSDPALPSPESWGHPDTAQIGEGCPKVAGSYKLVPEVYEAKGETGKLEPIVGKRGDFVGIFVHPRRTTSWASVSRVQALSQPVPSEKLTITLEQTSAKEFHLLYYSFDGRREFRVTFDGAQRDFICKDGYIEIPFRLVEGHAEGRTYRIDTYRRFTRMADGALVFYEQHRTWSREALVFTKSETRHRYYRFLPTEPPR